MFLSGKNRSTHRCVSGFFESLIRFEVLPANLERYWLILIFAISVFPKTISVVFSVIDPFTYSPLATSQLSVDAGHILVHPFEALARKTTHVIGLPREELLSISIVATHTIRSSEVSSR